jgi:carboxyl-terminal processing protease
MRKLRDEKTVSLNEQERRKERDEQEAKRKARDEIASGHATPDADPASKTVQKIGDDAKDRKTVKRVDIADTGTVAAATDKPAKVADGDKDDVAANGDDGLQPDERDISSDIKREKEAKSKRDVVLDEAAHILADEVGLIRTDTKLAARVLPYGVVPPMQVD